MGRYGGQIASARTSCECMRFEVDWTQREDGRMDFFAVLSGLESETCVKRQTFWSTPEVNTEVPSYIIVV